MQKILCGGDSFPARSYLFGGQTTSYEHTNYVANNRKLDLESWTGNGGAGVRNKLDGSSGGAGRVVVVVAHRTDVVQRREAGREG